MFFSFIIYDQLIIFSSEKLLEKGKYFEKIFKNYAFYCEAKKKGKNVSDRSMF